MRTPHVKYGQTNFNQQPLLGSLCSVFWARPYLTAATFILIVAIVSVIPLSYLWSWWILTSRVSPWSSVLTGLLTVYAAAEVVFSVYHVIMQYGKWFFGANIEMLQYGYVLDWGSFAFYGTEYNLLEKKQEAKLREMLDKLVTAIGVKMAKGRNPNVKFMKHVLDPVHVIPRPLVSYLVTGVFMPYLATLILKWKGYVFYKHGDVLLYVSDLHQQTEEPPIVFIHGIGAGLIIYLPFLLHLHSHPNRRNRRIILVSMPYISMRFPSTRGIPSRKSFLVSFNALCSQLNVKSATFVGHSYGTVTLSWILGQHPDLVDSAVFIDPVCFELSEPDIIYNFFYRSPRALAEIFTWYFVRVELGIAYFIGRHFWWFENILFAEQLPERSCVFISGSDHVVNSNSVREYLKEHNIKHHFEPNHGHGGFLLDRKAWEEIAACL